MVDQTALYAVLGLRPGSDRAAVRDAYRSLARQFHPDVNRSADAAERMLALNEAYNTLRDLPSPDSRSPGAAGTAATWPAGVTTSRSASAPFSGFDYRSVTSTGAVSIGSPLFVPINGVTIGIVGVFVGLVALLAVWAFAVTKPFGAGSATVSQSRVSAPATAGSVQNTTSALAAQASANAAANAAAARNNLTSGSAAAPTSVASAASGSAVSVAQPLAAEAVVQTQNMPEAPIAGPRQTDVPAQAQSSQAQNNQTQSRPVQPSLPAVPATQQNVAPHISAVGGQPPANSVSTAAPASAPASTDAAVAQTATRALSAYDKAWTSYAGALRFAAAGNLMTNAASISAPTGAARLASMSPASLLSGDAQLTMARTAHFQQQLAWNTQASAALTAAAAANSTAPRPDLAKSARADQRLRQAADLVSQSSNAGSPLNTTQLKTLLDEAELLHRESVAEWAKLLASLS